VVRPQELIEASAGHAEHRDAAANGRWSQAVVLVWRSVKFVADAKIERERWIYLPIVFQEDGPIVLMRPGELSRVIEETVPLRILRIVDVIVHLRAVERPRQEIEKAVGHALIVRHQARHGRIV